MITTLVYGSRQAFSVFFCCVAFSLSTISSRRRSHDWYKFVRKFCLGFHISAPVLVAPSVLVVSLLGTSPSSSIRPGLPVGTDFRGSSRNDIASASLSFDPSIWFPFDKLFSSLSSHDVTINALIIFYLVISLFLQNQSS